MESSQAQDWHAIDQQDCSVSRGKAQDNGSKVADVHRGWKRDIAGATFTEPMSRNSRLRNSTWASTPADPNPVAPISKTRLWRVTRR
jgi:hypothetical protein